MRVDNRDLMNQIFTIGQMCLLRFLLLLEFYFMSNISISPSVFKEFLPVISILGGWHVDQLAFAEIVFHCDHGLDELFRLHEHFTFDYYKC